MENLKRLAALWQLLATKSQLSEYVCEADLATFNRRVQAEGMPFLTQTLPRLFKSLDAAFGSSKLEAPVGFKVKKGYAYPLFLCGAWAAIFDKDGSLKSTAEQQSGAVLCIRQLSAIFYKLELPYTDDQVAKTTSSFKQAEADLRDLDLSTEAPSLLLKRAGGIVRRLLTGVNPLDIRPRHGSGSSACKVVPWERYSSFRYIERLARVYPYDEYFFYNHTHLCDCMDELLEAEEAEPMARVVYVPKDSRGPRLISCEPREFMFVQQGLMTLMYDRIREYPAIADQVNCLDQSRNQRLAQSASITGNFATLDLKEASDRVSLEMVRTIFPENWVACLEASRSGSTMLPNGMIMPLAKFAPMGSACCFPVEAICFWSIALAACGCDRDYLNRLFTNRLKDTDMRMSVFGDDIIVPTEHAQKVIRAFEVCGLLVNRSKSYWAGPFRESCGGDYHLGVNVAPVRCKHLPDSDDKFAPLRIADLFNNISTRYEDWTLTYQLHELFSSWFGPVPISANLYTRLAEQSERWEMGPNGLQPIGLTKSCVKPFAGLALRGRYTDVPGTYRTRWNHHLQRREFRVPIESAINKKVDSDRWGQVLRRELQELSDRPANICALAKRTRIKYGWTTL